LLDLLLIICFLPSFFDSQELEKLDEDANVYKLIGPVLIKQDLVEAKSNVGKRLEFISNET
jgi:prefoldin beta subunit